MPDPIVRGPWSRDEPEDGIALCLSGGGYRAMLFHAGALWRLYEVGLLREVKRISSVSGGSIAAGALAAAWSSLNHEPAMLRQDFVPNVVVPLRRLANRTIDRGAIVSGALPFISVGDRVQAAYEKHLFGNRTLQDLPDSPRFVFNATNVQSGALWRFSKPYMRDYRVGMVPNPTTRLSAAVAASSAFPPLLSPFRLDLNPGDFTPGSGQDLQTEPYTEQAFLSDGGVYDNLGLETAFKRYRTILVSDAGAKLASEPEPHEDYVRHSIRVGDIIDDQVRSLRKRQLIESFQNGERAGTYWGIRTNIADYQLASAIPVPHAKSLALAILPTRLRRLDDEVQARLINWGYAVCDAAIRRHVNDGIAEPSELPYAEVGWG